MTKTNRVWLVFEGLPGETPLVAGVYSSEPEALRFANAMRERDPRLGVFIEEHTVTERSPL